MRLRLDPVSAHHVGNLAKQENRSFTNALAALVYEGVRARHGIAAEPITAIEQRGDGCRTIAAHVRGDVNTAVRHFAERERRSLSSAINLLIRAGLHVYGVTQAPAE